MRIVVTGSLAYDYIMNFPGQFKDHILPDKVHMLTVSFLVDTMKRLRGGVAGNIAYSLALLGERPLVVATAGTDFSDYRRWMERCGIDATGIVEIEDEFTASCFINTDQSHNQIVAFYAGAMAHAKNLTLRGRELTPDDWVIISPTDPEAIVRYADECRSLKVPYIFDPGKQTPRLTRAQIESGLNGAAVLIGNDYEFGMMAKVLGISEAELCQRAPVSVVTRGDQGSTFFFRGAAQKELVIPCAKVSSVVDPTGAGDAFLAGLAYGLSRKLPYEVVGRIAALAATYAIEHKGCQEHRFTRTEFVRRYTETFGAARELELLAGEA